MARALVRGVRGARSYSGALGGRLTSSWRSPISTADAELHESLQKLRDRSRELVRNSGYAKRAKSIVVNNVVGAGIGMQGQVRPMFREPLEVRTNDAIESAWDEWTRAENCHTGGRLDFADMERVLMGEVFEAGEVIVRMHHAPFGDSKIPLGLEVIESERIADNWVLPPGVAPTRYRLGVEVDQFARPVAYWINTRHPGDVRAFLGAQVAEQLVRVPADQIIHLAIIDRWPQSRGVPWLHAAMRRMNDLDGYAEAEIVAARGAAAYMAVIKSAAADNPLAPEQEPAGEQQFGLEPGLVQRLEPGDEMLFNNPNRPNPNFDPFLRAILREIASGIGVSYESLSRDYSQSNYSSSRLALLDDRDLWRTLQQWFIRSFRARLHRAWIEAAVLSRAIPTVSIEAYAARPEKYTEAKFKPRGVGGWVDPEKEVRAYKEAIKAGFTTVADVISATGSGMDIEDVLSGREQELEDMKDRGLVFDTDPAVYAAPKPAPAPKAEPAEEPKKEEPAERVATLRKVN